MKLNSLIVAISLSLLFVSFQVFAKSEAQEMCKCLETAYKSKDQKKGKECLALQEKHVKKLKKGSEAHSKYKEDVNSCEKNLTSSSEPSPEGFDAQKEAVCKCFAETKPPAKCFQLQDKFSKQQGDRKVEFIQATNSCSN